MHWFFVNSIKTLNFQSMWGVRDSVTSIFLLKNLATPTRLTSLRLSHPPHATSHQELLGSNCRCGVLSKKFELISPKICRAGGIPPRPPFRPPAEATLSDWTISSFSFRFKRNSGLRPVWWQILLCF